jgi:hypothetical protein
MEGRRFETIAIDDLSKKDEIAVETPSVRLKCLVVVAFQSADANMAFSDLPSLLDALGFEE